MRHTQDTFLTYLPSGDFPAASCLISSNPEMPRDAIVRIGPGERQFTRTPPGPMVAAVGEAIPEGLLQPSPPSSMARARAQPSREALAGPITL